MHMIVEVAIPLRNHCIISDHYVLHPQPQQGFWIEMFMHPYSSLQVPSQQQMWSQRSLHSSSCFKLFNMIQLFVDVSQCFAGGSGCFYGHEMGISSLKGHRGAGDGCEGAVRSFAATSDGAPSSLHRRLSAGYCRILPDIAGYCWILLDCFFGVCVLLGFTSNIQHHSTKNNPNDHFAIACRQVEGWQLLRGPLAIQWVATPRALAIQWIATPRGRDRCGHPQRFWWRPSMKSFHVVKPKKKHPHYDQKTA